MGEEEREFNKYYESGYYSVFLVACTRLYNPLCLSVGWSVRLSVHHA